jgi:hypothetical protein
VTGRGRRRPAAAAGAAVLVVGIVAALGAAPAAADPAVPDDATLEEWGAVIGEIVVRAGDIFNTSEPAEDRALYRVANRLHRGGRNSCPIRVLPDRLQQHRSRCWPRDFCERQRRG